MHHQRMDIPSCPFCPFSDSDPQFVAEHIEFCHPENGTPSIEHGGSAIEQQETAPWADEGKYIDCPHGCGELIVDTELPTHMDLHFAEEVANEETGSPQIEARNEGSDAYRSDEFPADDDDLDTYGHLKKKGRSGQKRGALRETSQKGSIAPSPPKTTVAGGVKRLGRAELGPHAHEKRMPLWLLRMLEKGPKITQSNKISSDGKLLKHETVENETAHIVPVLSRLCEQDTSVQRAFLCSSKVHHVFKMPREGGFCGYRNMQMLISYIQGSQSPGYENFSKGLPTIIELQDMIEHAWDMGFNSVGKVETGGIRGTRKYIGTPEAQALFSSLGIQCEANSIAETKDVRAHDALYMNVAAYFRPACSLEKDDKVIKTELPPIYLQHQGHSLTIIGFEIRENGGANLLVFDSMFKTSPAIKRLIGTSVKSSEPARLLKAYRRGSAYLQKYKIFEILNAPRKISPLSLSFELPTIVWLPNLALLLRANMRESPNVIITGTPGVGKTVHCEQLAQETGLRHLSVNKVAKDRGCFETYDQELETWVVDEDKLLDAIEDEVLQGGYLIDWHACDLFPKSWIDLVVVLRCPSTSVHYDRLSTREYPQAKLQENLDAEIFGVLLEEARESFEQEIVIELDSEKDDDVESNCARISTWVESWKRTQAENPD